MRAVSSTLHQMMKSPTEEGVKIVYGEQHAANEMFAIDEVVPTPEPSTLEKSSIEARAIGLIGQMAIEFSGYGIEYQPRTTIKFQVLADFVANFTPTLIPEVEKELLLSSGTTSEAESTTKTIIQNLKKRLDDAKGKWREVLPEVLWAYRTTSKSSTGATPFSLVYGSEALIPVEVGEPSARFRHASKESNHEAMNASLELLDEKR
uniref:Uncharacterized protein LOC104235845 n=1 Tax=Nicotiana sylvestris TaxID=4096 RepID=A0A1U7XAT4_NICSY|nr:PREDICTED: uncharacterized protein LOC104235845 [Nicotiana sylvestris]